jgi:predicted Zn finger-like uncharacterized protein
MILTCPECATSYFVDDAKVPAAGRLVKCTSCGARWTASKDATPAAVAPAPKPAPPPQPEPFVPSVDDDLVVSPIEAATTFAATRAARANPRREAAGKVVVWAVAGVVVVGLIASAIVFRSQVVQLLPASQTAYAGIGLPVNALGLVIESVSAKPVFQGGRPVLAVTGVIRSVHDKPTSAPALRISLLDRAGKPVAVKVATPLDASVPAHSTRHFAIAIVDPPASVHDLEVAFDAPEKGAPHGPAAVHAAVAEHGVEPAADNAPDPAPVEAQPLPPGSKDALPHHD